MCGLRNDKTSKEKSICPLKQECIPVGCVPSAAVAVCWGMSASVHAGIHPPGCGPGPLLGVDMDTPWVWACTPLGLDTQPPPPGVGLDPPGLGLYTSPRTDHPTSALGLDLDTPPPVNRITDTCKKHNLVPTSLRTVMICERNSTPREYSSTYTVSKTVSHCDAMKSGNICY